MRQKYAIATDGLTLPVMESTRLKKVSRLLEKEMGEIVRMMAKNHFSGSLISVTKVRVSPDLSLAKVYLSIFAIKDKSEVMHYVEEHKSSIRKQLAMIVGKQLRIVPELAFFLDDSIDYEENIERLLRGEGENPIR
jgi:ribosome-binding factor A